jgi:hypothetical protein
MINSNSNTSASVTLSTRNNTHVSFVPVKVEIRTIKIDDKEYEVYV